PSIGSYTLRTEGPRQATPQDRKRMEALGVFIETQQLEKPGTPDTRRQAIPRYEAALKIWREAGDPEGEGNSLTAIGRDYVILRNNLGNAYWVTGEERKALDSLGLALKIRQEISDQLGIAYTLQTFGIVYSSMGEPQKALDSYAQAVPIWQAQNNKTGEANAL